MKIHRRIIRTLALVLGVSGALPLAANASTLLSGYGGPGQGNQAILGSALMNGPRSGGGGGSGGAGGSSGTPSGSTTAAAGNGVAEAEIGSATPSGAAGAGREASGRASKRAQGPARGSATAAGTARGTRPALAGPAGIAGNYPAIEHGAGGTSVALGLSGEELLYAMLALGTLLLFGVVAARTARTAAARGGNG